jgi:endonuclease/exonuclease/phosphatase family metal-dependent hydrolase
MTTFTVCASNLTSEPEQSYQESGNNILKTLRPDIVFMNEFKVGPRASLHENDITDWVRNIFGSNYKWKMENLDADDTIPNGIIFNSNKIKMINYGQIRDIIENRDHCYAQVEINNKNVWIFCVHLPYKASRRERETENLINEIKKIIKQDPDPYIIIGGDFNFKSFNDKSLNIMKNSGLFDIPNNKDDFPKDYNGNHFTNNSRNKPFDWVFSSNNIEKDKYKFGKKEDFLYGFIYDTRIFTQQEADDFNIIGWEQDDSDDHQHMAVIRQFKL